MRGQGVAAGTGYLQMYAMALMGRVAPGSRRVSVFASVTVTYA